MKLRSASALLLAAATLLFALLSRSLASKKLDLGHLPLSTPPSTTFLSKKISSGSSRTSWTWSPSPLSPPCPRGSPTSRGPLSGARSASKKRASKTSKSSGRHRKRVGTTGGNLLPRRLSTETGSTPALTRRSF